MRYSFLSFCGFCSESMFLFRFFFCLMIFVAYKYVGLLFRVCLMWKSMSLCIVFWIEISLATYFFKASISLIIAIRTIIGTVWTISSIVRAWSFVNDIVVWHSKQSRFLNENILLLQSERQSDCANSLYLFGHSFFFFFKCIPFSSLLDLFGLPKEQ